MWGGTWHYGRTLRAGDLGPVDFLCQSQGRCIRGVGRAEGLCDVTVAIQSKVSPAQRSTLVLQALEVVM
jgi:hypothetical protein